MNASRLSQSTAIDLEESGRLATLERFRIEDIQHLGQADLLTAQSLAGHGDVWGCWETPKSLSPGVLDNCYREIDLAKRLRDFLDKEPASAAVPDTLIADGVLLLTRLALISRLVGAGGRNNDQTQRLKPSSIAQYLYQYWPRITAQAIRRKAEDLNAPGLLACLYESDVLEFSAYHKTRVEISRIDVMVVKGLWSDAPPLPNITQTTDPSGIEATRTPQKIPVPHPPIPDDYMAVIGPRVLWIVQEMGPHFLRLMEVLPVFLQTLDWSLSGENNSRHLRNFIAGQMATHPWQNHAGHSLVPPFPIITAGAASRRHGVNKQEWPPRTWEHIINLSILLQSAHLFVSLLSCAGRVGEVETLTRNCVVFERDGRDYLRGHTYKLSGNLFGDARQWPAPDILRQCLGQQARLATVWDSIPKSLKASSLPEVPRFEGSLWVSLGVGGNAGRDGSRICVNDTLMSLATRIGMDPKPSGKNLHAHRFRKTIGRLAGVALFNSPLVLKQLFGHKSIEMTLHYILSDPGIREEAEKVLRELRIMHCVDALEEVHQALQNGEPIPGHGGAGAARLVTAVVNEGKRLEQSGRMWGEGSAYDLAYLLTAQGKGWRLIKENIVCSKVPGEDGMCQKKRSKGEPNTANCQPECNNRIVLARQRRDTELVVEQYLDIARKARGDGQLLVLAGVMKNFRDELENFADLKEQYLANPDVQSLLNLCDEPAESEEAERMV